MHLDRIESKKSILFSIPKTNLCTWKVCTFLGFCVTGAYLALKLNKTLSFSISPPWHDWLTDKGPTDHVPWTITRECMEVSTLSVSEDANLNIPMVWPDSRGFLSQRMRFTQGWKVMKSWLVVMFAPTPGAELSPIRRNEPDDMLFLCRLQCGSCSTVWDVEILGLFRPLYFRRSFNAGHHVFPEQPVYW